MSVLLKGGTVVTTTGRYVADVYVEDGKIKSVGTNLDKKADEVVNCKGKYILPGTIDPWTSPCR
jgi:dihydropyrimidinase